MSIQALTGLPGHGKSYSAIEIFILAAAKEKRCIVTNIPTTEKLKEDFPELDLIFIDLDQAKEDQSILDSIPGGALVLLDELWRIWPAGLSAKNIPVWQMAFIKEHRHKLSESGREMDIVLVTQDLGDIAASIRTMVETTVICRKLTDVGMKNRFRRDYYRGSIKGFSGPKNTFIKSDHGCKYVPEIYQYYKSHTKSTGTYDQIDNDGVLQSSIFGLGFKIGAVFVLFLIAFVVYGYISTSNDIEEMTKAKEPVEKTDKPLKSLKSVPVKMIAASAPVPVVPVDSQRWRLVGHVVDGLSIKFYMISDGQNTRRIEARFCRLGLDPSCIVDGERIAADTGRNFQYAIPQLATMPAYGVSSNMIETEAVP